MTASTPASTNYTGRQLSYSVTSYCDTGTMSDGQQTHAGVAAIMDRSIPFGTRIYVPGWGVVTIEDHIGHGSDLDLWQGSCAGADQWGRRQLTVTILS